MQAMCAAFITMNMTGVPPSKANPIGRTFRRFRGHRRNADHDTGHIIYCMHNCSYYNTVSDFQMMSLHTFNCKILFPILSNFKNFKRYS